MYYFRFTTYFSGPRFCCCVNEDKMRRRNEIRLRFNNLAKRTGVRKSNEGSDQGGEIVAKCLPVYGIVSIRGSTSASGLSAVCTCHTDG